jgi:hypothetical protein
MRNHFRRLPRFLTKRTPREPSRPVGVCSTCGVEFVAPADRREHVEDVLRVHESICPGGRRGGDVASPFH